MHLALGFQVRDCGPLSVCFLAWNVNSVGAEIVVVLYSEESPAPRGVSVAELALNK